MESITQWDPNRVHQWMCSIGFPNYEKQIKDNGISGDLLIHLDHAALKDLSIWEVGKRLLILKAIYQLKISYGISLEAGDYVPPNNTIQHLVREVERMSKDMTKLKDELWMMQKDQKPLPEPSPAYSKFGTNGQASSTSSSTSSAMLSASQSTHATNTALPPQSPIHASHANSSSARSPIYSSDSGFHSVPSSPHSPGDIRGRGGSTMDTHEEGKAIGSPGVDGAGAIKVYGQKPSTVRERDPVDAFKSFRISQDDPCHKVLPAALKKYKINDDWRQYALFICYGNTERILTYNDKPLLLMKQLKEKKENPVFMLKHIKQMKSPAASASTLPILHPPRKSSDLLNKELPLPPEVMSGSSTGNGASNGNSLSPTAAHTNGHQSSLVRSGTTSSMRTSSKTAATTPSTSSQNQTTSSSHSKTESSSSSTLGAAVGPKPENYVQETVEASGMAVALYEWEAKRDDELNVKVGDVFKIKSKGHGWWVVQRDEEIGWIPASILSESSSEDGYFSAEGVAIFDFTKTGPNELSIKTGDKLFGHDDS
ncbi:Adaptor for signal transduction, partial [Linnemannia exigua]